tara:strand:+ start:18794 stop:20059 length:1266 start_codon:yes stop_codon:yes gene_type:complete
MKLNNNIIKFYLSGDKSIAIRALILCIYYKGIHKIYNLPNNDDVKSTLSALNKIGLKFKLIKNGIQLNSTKLKLNNLEIDCNESATAARLLMGYFSGLNIKTIIKGQKTLKNRPMERIINPLKSVGVNIKSNDQLLPLQILGSDYLKPLDIKLEIASAQIKSALILYAMSINGESKIGGLIDTRDHLERMLLYNKYPIKIKNNEIRILGNSNNIKNLNIKIPGDISSASFLICASILSKNSNIQIMNVCINKYRTGFIDVACKMGAKIIIKNKRNINGESVGDIYVLNGEKLKGINIDKNIVPNIIDEIPIISILAINADGKTTFNGISELRVKESDRLKAIISNIKLMNGDSAELKDNLVINGNKKLHNTTISSFNDHRIFMSFYIANKLINKNYKDKTNDNCYQKTFPNFIDEMDKVIN